MAFQTLFREQLGPVDGKVKTNTSVAESNYEKLYSLKTEVVCTLFSLMIKKAILKEKLKS